MSNLILDGNAHLFIAKRISQLSGVFPDIGRVGMRGELNSVSGAKSMAETGAIKWHSGPSIMIVGLGRCGSLRAMRSL